MPLAEITVETVTTTDGIQLHTVEHAVDDSVGSVLLVHGLGEHSGRYAHVVEILNRSGLNVVLFDQRGHGLSEGQRGHLPEYDNLLDDVTLLLEQMVNKRPDHRIVLYGHSMGGGVIANWTLRRFEEWSDYIVGTVLSAPWFRLATPPSSLKVMAIKHLSRLCPAASIPTNLRVKDLCRDEAAIQRFQKDDLNHGRITLKTAWECYLAGQWALENAEAFPVPLLAIHGSDDRITSHEATHQFCEKISNSHFVPLDRLIHEPHHDPKWREVVYHVTEWVLKRYQFAYAA